MKLSDRIELFTARLSGTFDLTAYEGEQLENDEEVTILVRGHVKQAVLGITRSGSLRLCYVVAPTEARLVNDDGDWDNTAMSAVSTVSLPEHVEFDPDEQPDVDWDPASEDIFVPPASPARPSMVSPNGNVAGGSQAEHDSALAEFLYGGQR